MKRFVGVVLFVGAALASATGMASAQLTRAEVKARLSAAQADGSLAAFDGQDSGSFYLSKHFHSNETRSQVESELATTTRSGLLNVLDGQDSGSKYLRTTFRSTEPRSQVKSDLLKARKNGTLDEFTGEDSGSFELAADRARANARRAALAR